MKNILIWIIQIYQKTISPDKGVIRYFFANKYQHCQMYPTCSEYMILSIKKYGSIKGLFKGIRRIFRCHPYQKNLIDIP